MYYCRDKNKPCNNATEYGYCQITACTNHENNKIDYAFWKNRAEHNDHLWCECSNCGFRVEAYKAVKIGRSSDDYVGVKYNYCPICGKPMVIETK